MLQREQVITEIHDARFPPRSISGGDGGGGGGDGGGKAKGHTGVRTKTFIVAVNFTG